MRNHAARSQTAVWDMRREVSFELEDYEIVVKTRVAMAIAPR